MPQDHYSLTYRASEAGQVMDWIKAGQSGSLIGLRGVGKSAFLRFLLRNEVRQHYLGDDYADIIFVPLNLLALPEQVEWAVFEIILNRLLGQLRSVGVARELIEKIVALHQEVRHTREPLSAQWAVEQSVDLICRRPAQQIVFLFDEFDAVFQTLDSSLFRCLRAIHDSHEGQISYLIVVTGELSGLRDDLTEVDHFYRLVSRNVCGLGPYSQADTRQMIRQLTSRRSIEFNEADTATLIELSGGHAGLLKAIISWLWNNPQDEIINLPGLSPLLLNETTVQAECRKIWDGLAENDRIALQNLIENAPVKPVAFQHLKRRGLVRGGQSMATLFSPLFADFIRQQTSSVVESIIINRSPQEVQLGGRNIETLTELEFEMLSYLYEHRDNICTKDELIQNVYRHQYGQMTGGVTDEALQALISRLRAKIEPDTGRYRYIVTIRGEGYRFMEPVGY